MKKLLFSLVGLLIVGAIALPLVVKKQADSQIEAKKQSLLKNGAELNIISEDGYIATKREYALTIINGKKFRDNILNKLIKIDPGYKVFAELTKKSTDKNIRTALDGTTFSGFIENSNLLLFTPKIELSLVRFSDKVMSSLKPDEEISDRLKSMLDEKTITFFIDLDSNLNISQIVMKDIDEDMNDKGKTVNIKLKGHKLNIDNTAKASKISYKLDTQSVTADNFAMQIKGLKYTFNYLSQFQNEVAVHLDSFSVSEHNNDFMVGNIDIDTNVEEAVNDTLKINVNYSVKDVHFQEKRTVKLGSYILKLNVSDISKEGLVSFNESYNKMILNKTTLTSQDIEALTTGLQKILNKGLQAQIKSSIKDLVFQTINLNKIDLIINAKLNPNTSALKGFQMIQALEVDGSVIMHKNDIKEILKLNKSLENFTKLGKKDGDNIVFNYEFKKGSLSLNGNKL